MGLTDVAGDCLERESSWLCINSYFACPSVSPQPALASMGTKCALPCNKVTAFQVALCARFEGVRRLQWRSGTFMCGASICVNLATRHLISAAWQRRGTRGVNHYILRGLSCPRIMAFYATRRAPRGGGGMQCGLCPLAKASWRGAMGSCASPLNLCLRSATDSASRQTKGRIASGQRGGRLRYAAPSSARRAC